MNIEQRIIAATDSQGRLSDPNLMAEDTPPMLRFERSTLKDPVETERRGLYTPMDAILVHMRAYGDIKNEVPYVAEKTAYTPSIEQVLVEKTVPVRVIKEDEQGNRVEEVRYETKEVLEDKATYTAALVSPWITTLKDRLNNGKITRNFYDHCIEAFERWKASGDVPINGYPVIEWRMITPAQQERLVLMGLNAVEKVAEMTEDAMQEYGMGARDLKRKAAEFLLAGTDQAKSAAKIISLETQNDMMRAELSRVQEKMVELEQLRMAEQQAEEANVPPNTGTEDR